MLRSNCLDNDSRSGGTASKPSAFIVKRKPVVSPSTGSESDATIHNLSEKICQRWVPRKMLKKRELLVSLTTTVSSQRDDSFSYGSHVFGRESTVFYGPIAGSHRTQEQQPSLVSLPP